MRKDSPLSLKSQFCESSLGSKVVLVGRHLLGFFFAPLSGENSAFPTPALYGMRGKWSRDHVMQYHEYTPPLPLDGIDRHP